MRENFQCDKSEIWTQISTYSKTGTANKAGKSETRAQNSTCTKNSKQ